jgi:hypothetical protein
LVEEIESYRDHALVLFLLLLQSTTAGHHGLRISQALSTPQKT